VHDAELRTIIGLCECTVKLRQTPEFHVVVIKWRSLYFSSNRVETLLAKRFCFSWLINHQKLFLNARLLSSGYVPSSIYLFSRHGLCPLASVDLELILEQWIRKMFTDKEQRNECFCCFVHSCQASSKMYLPARYGHILCCTVYLAIHRPQTSCCVPTTSLDARHHRYINIMEVKIQWSPRFTN
jgi:hypothetical protein